MNVILNWLSQQVIWISVISLIGALGYVMAALLSKRRRDTAQFTLEREVYHQRMARAWLVAALFLTLAAMIFTISIYWAPSGALSSAGGGPGNGTATPSNGLFTLTPAPNQFIPNATLTASGAVTDVVVTAPDLLAPSPTPPPGAVGGGSTPIPQELLQPDCPSPGAQLTFPVAGGGLSGIVEVLGTAQVNAFSYYRFEVIFPGSDTPNFIAQIDQPVENGSLGQWDVSDASRYPPGGPYRFRLVVVDIYGNTASCTIPVNIGTEER